MNLPSGGTHFVVLTGREGASDYWVNDPWEQNAMHVHFLGGMVHAGPDLRGVRLRLISRASQCAPPTRLVR